MTGSFFYKRYVQKAIFGVKGTVFEHYVAFELTFKLFCRFDSSYDKRYN